ncbi:MAG: ABC transporter transmembrane domain-containing protein [Pseudomonadota bacterium]
MTDTTDTLVDAPAHDRRAAAPDEYGDLNRSEGRSLRSLAMLWPYVRQHPLTVIVALIFLLLGTALTLFIPLLLGDAVDAGLGGSVDDAQLLQVIDGNFFLVFLAVVILGFIGATRFYLISRFGQRIAADLRRDLYGHMLSLSPRWHGHMRSGEAVSRLTADITLIETFLGSSTSFGLRTLINTIGALGMIFLINWKLGGGLLLVIPVVMVPVLVIGRWVRKLSNETQTRLANAGGEAAEALDSIELVQAYNRESKSRARFTEASEATFSAAMRRIGAEAGMTVVFTSLLTGSIVGLLWLGARWVTTGLMTGGELSSLVLYSVFASSGFISMAEIYGQIMRAAGAADRATEVFDTKPEIAAPETPQNLPSPVTGALRFENVTFAYDTHERPALQDFNLDIAPGEFVALVGPSGGGKSTVFRLALRLFDPAAGAVRLDGVAAPQADPHEWRGQFAYAAQDATLFTGTARDNIAIGADRVTDAALRQAAESAEAWSFLEERGGLDAELGTKGRALSGGQRQRIALARALARNAPVLLLDEATSALDSESEALVRQALEAAAKGRTTLAIAHRLSTVRQADRIIVMDGGRVVETGTHDTLVARGGLYARLAEMQFAGV